MRERPILFSGEMVRAILDGSKTQTRRVVNFHNSMCQPKVRRDQWGRIQFDRATIGDGPCLKVPILGSNFSPTANPEIAISVYPRYEVGDRLWVRESFADIRSAGFGTNPVTDKPWEVAYKAETTEGSYGDDIRKDYGIKWKPSIHMPRWASRLTLEIVSIRVERVQDISNENALREGIHYVHKNHGVDNISFFSILWDSINAKRGYGWAENPWVWVVEFKVIYE